MDHIEVGQRIVCAANRDESGAIILGARHWDGCMHKAYELWVSATNHQTKDMRFTEQGFIDQRGNFLTREEAYGVAARAGQIIRSVGGDNYSDEEGNTIGRLFSENLY